MSNRKRRRSSSEVIGSKDGKQQKIDKFISSTQTETTCLTNRYAVLDSDTLVLPGEEEGNKPPLETNPQLHCCQQLPAMLMELFSKEAILTSRSMAMLLEKIKDIDSKVNTLKEEFNNIATMPRLIRGRDKRDAEFTWSNKTADSDLQPAEKTPGQQTERSSLTLQKDCLAVSFNSQTDFYKWRNFKMITLSLSQLLKCSFSEVLLKSFYRLPRIGTFSRIVLQFKNDNIPVRMMSLQKTFYYKFGIRVTRVFKNNICAPLCLKISSTRKFRGGLGDISGNKMLDPNTALESDSQTRYISQAEKPQMSSEPIRPDFDHTKRVTQVGPQDSLLLENAICNPYERPQDGALEVDVSYGQKLTSCNKRMTLETDLDSRLHQAASRTPGTPINKKSLAIELLEAEQALDHQASLPHSDEISMEGVENVEPPSFLAPLAKQRTERDPMLQTQLRGNLDNSTEDMLYLTFGDLSPQEQHEVIERLEYTKNRLLTMKEMESPNDPAELQGTRDTESGSGRSILIPKEVKICQNHQDKQDQSIREDKREMSICSPSKPVGSNTGPSRINGCVFDNADGQLDLISTQ